MKTNFMLLLLLMNISTVFAQNNPIFGGGNADGFDKINFAQPSNNIFTGGNADGWTKTSFAQAENNIFNGGVGDGWDKTSFAQSLNNIYNGGNADGWSNTSFAQAVNNIYNGGNADGWDKTSFFQAENNIFFGGQGDGWSNTYRPMGPLPVTLLSFIASKYAVHSSILKWKTSLEINTDKFEVEISNDAINFKKIGYVKAAGNTSIASEYSFIDNNPTVGINYYRLKQIDLDGHFVYTPVRTVVFEGLSNEKVKYYPNPTNGLLTMEIPMIDNHSIKLINIINDAGIVVNQLRIINNTNNKIQIDLAKYPKGIYFIQLRTNSLNSTERIILN